MQVGCGFCGYFRQYDDQMGGFVGVCPECGQRLEPVSSAAARQMLREWDIARRYRRPVTVGTPDRAENDDSDPTLAA